MIEDPGGHGGRSPWSPDVTSPPTFDVHGLPPRVVTAPPPERITNSGPRDRPRAAESASPVLHFVGGLPRCGATALLTLLHQNPRVCAAPVSGLGTLFQQIDSNWGQIEYHQERPDSRQQVRVLRALLARYHETDRPVVLDKQRLWMASIPRLEEVLGRRIKVLAPVRSIPEILTSFEALRARHPDFTTSPDLVLGDASSVASRAAWHMRDGSTLRMALDAMRFAVQRGYGDRILFIDYNKLMADAHGQLRRIYRFLDEPYFDHDLDNIEPLGPFDSRSQGFKGLHDVRRSFRRRSADPREVLGRDLAAVYRGPAPWEPFT